MRKIVENMWDTLNDLEELIQYGYKTDSREKYINTPLKPRLISQSSLVPGDSLTKISDEILKCRKCVLCERRNKVVPGSGSDNPKVLIIGEGPRGDEDRQGLPFVGGAGQYLDKWLSAINLDRKKDCFLCHIVKCRLPGNRDPEESEISACFEYLERQITLLKPHMILTLGRIAGRILTGEESGVSEMRRGIHSYKGITVIPTYHPSDVLRDQQKYKRPVWEDLQKLKAELDNGRK